MLPYKLTIAFDDLNKLIDFYKNQLQKDHRKTMATIASMGAKGQITNNPDGSLTLTMFFRTYSKYDKFTQAYLDSIFVPSIYVSSKIKVDYD
jgi:hypothetical protein